MNAAGLKQTALWRAAREVKRTLLPPRSADPLSAADRVGRIEVIERPAAVEVGRRSRWTFRLTNRGSRPWPCDGPNPVAVQGQWLTPAGDPFGDPCLIPLAESVYPGEPVTLSETVASPEFVGDFGFRVDLAQPAGGVFQSATVRPVPALWPPDRDIDYHAVYRSADLSANHWWVVGAYHSRDEYVRSSRTRLEMLTQLGLTPDSRVLDIGCGTGQMGEALEGYLSDRGAYYGTDIGAEAISFCLKRFGRPNFVFRRGEMTAVPFAADADGRFDVAIFFSVFTHTFTDESALLLAEAVRLLAPGGSVVADIIVSPLVERCGGNRGEMVVNREHFFRLAGMVGLAGEVIGTFPWNPYAERLMIRFRRPG
jgi:SAM-dependent methyltransferase